MSAWRRAFAGWLFRLSCWLHRAYEAVDGAPHPLGERPADALFEWLDPMTDETAGRPVGLWLLETLTHYEPYTLRVQMGLGFIELNVPADVLRDLADAIEERTVSGVRRHVWSER